jgi:hypothetical protein
MERQLEPVGKHVLEHHSYPGWALAIGIESVAAMSNAEQT